MPLILAFDVYGTLIDTQSITTQLADLVGNKAKEFSTVWRNKQLEYSFRRGLMRQYNDFSVCTSNALDFTCSYFDAPLNDAQKQTLLNAYRTLPAFSDVRNTLTQLRSANCSVYAFSNGTAAAVQELLENAGILDLFEDIVSVDAVRSFKPDPDVYKYLLKTVKAEDPANVWLVSSNPFDVIGAVATGLRTAWLQRAKTEVFDPWEFQATITVYGLADLYSSITNN